MLAKVLANLNKGTMLNGITPDCGLDVEIERFLVAMRIWSISKERSRICLDLLFLSS